MGFSQGGMLTFTLATHHPEVVGAAFPLAGWLPPSLMPEARRAHTRYPTIRAMHGADDPILPSARTELAADELSRRGYAIELLTFDDVRHEMSVEMWRHLEKWVVHEVRERLRTGRRVRGGMA
jgi:phospholipase/carboxylesterase